MKRPITGIYKITNNINGKVYIGQSVDIKRRWKEHKKEAFYKKSHCFDYPLYRAIRKYGIENFKFEILEECPQDMLNELEIFYINEYKATGENGYNQNDGGHDGSCNCKLTETDVVTIIQRLKTTLDNTKIIAKDFNVGFTTIRNINVGEAYYQEKIDYPIRPNIAQLVKSETKQGYINKTQKVHRCITCGAEVWKEGTLCVDCYRLSSRKVERPEPLELARLVKENGFVQTAKLFGITDNAMKKWCDGYGIPRHKDALVAWYNEQKGIVDIPKPIREKKFKKNRPVKQIDIITGEILNIFANQTEAFKYLSKKENSHIAEVCKGKRKSAHGFYWEWADI